MYMHSLELVFLSGGYIGLFTGMSFLSLFEFVVWLVKIPVIVIRRWLIMRRHRVGTR